MGPFEEDSRAPDSVKEAWLLEKLYGPPQRWVLEIVPLEEFQDEDMESSEHLHVGEFKGIPVGVLTSKPVQRLHIELNGDGLRVFELDA
jgi:hypothetical protein